MKFSECWLREWINPNIDSNTLIDQMTMAGLEVNSIEPVANRFSGIVVGQVIEYRQHINVDYLQIVKVDIGSKRLLNIVCKNFNCCMNSRVVVATIGAVLPNNLKIKTIKLHGEFSEGILCSFFDLGISSENNKIIILPEDTPVGSDVWNYFKFYDNSIDIHINYNRADCFSLLGISRDISIFNRLPINKPEIHLVEKKINDYIPIYVDVSTNCLYYLSRVIKNININVPTPFYMHEKLRRCGIRTIDIISDIIHYVLLEFGQLIHVFDIRNIEGNLKLRLSTHGEKLTLLDDNEIILISDIPVISDKHKILAIPGIINCAASKIHLSTKDIVLKCAFFNSKIFTSCSFFHIYADSKYQYVRGSDPILQKKAMDRIVNFLLNICGGQPGPIISNKNCDVFSKTTSITLHYAKLNRLIGYIIPFKEVQEILVRLSCIVSCINEGWKVLMPDWRFNIECEEDLIEEIIRIYGYNNIPNIPVKSTLEISSFHKNSISLRRVKTLLVDRGYQEVITYSFVDPKIQHLFYPNQKSLLIKNPISIEMSTMRLSLLNGLLETIIYNQNRQQQRMRLFESGFCFTPDTSADLGIRQDLILSGVISGPHSDKHWNLSHRLADFYDIKGDIEAIFDLSGRLEEIEFRVQDSDILHPGQCATIYLKKEAIGIIGVIHPKLEDKLHLNGRILIFELLWEKISKYQSSEIVNVSRFPTIRRDISVIVSENINISDILNECKNVGKTKLISVNLFDVYRGKRIKKGYKSLAIRLLLQDSMCTISEKDVTKIVEQCIEVLQKKFQASLRH